MAQADEALLPAKDEQPIPPRVLLEKAIREIVREENIRKGEPEPPPVAPKPMDAFWLVLSITNVALFLWLLPTDPFSNHIVKAVIDLAPWLGTSAFAIGYTWLSARILTIIKGHKFKVMQVAAFIIFSCLSITQLAIFPVSRVVEPNGKVYLNGDYTPELTWRVPIKNAKVAVEFMGYSADKKGTADEWKYRREFPLSYMEVARAIFGYRPYYQQLYELPIAITGEASEVIIEKLDREFDSAFLLDPPPTLAGEKLDVLDDTRKVSLRLQKTKEYTIGIPLPYGRYRISVTAPKVAGCEKFPVNDDVRVPSKDSFGNPLSISFIRTCGVRNESN